MISISRNRREWLQIGGIGLGSLSLPMLSSAQRVYGRSEQGSFGQAKSIIVFGLVGGPPQHETWDPKPLAPSEIRGDFGTIPTRNPGYHIGELMPKTAALTDQIAVLRAVVTNDNSHSSSGYQMLTGIPHQPLNKENALPSPTNNAPCLGAIVRSLRNDSGHLPNAITIPEHIWNDGNLPWPGQDAGFLGRRFDPWLIPCQPQQGTVLVSGLKTIGDNSPRRASLRRRLLEQLDRQVRDSPVETEYHIHAQQALDLLSGPSSFNAFDISNESNATRDTYGRTRFGQSVLLARRLVEAGVSLVQVNWTRIAGFPNSGGWDTHTKHSESLKKFLMPIMDQAYSALLRDLMQRGMLEETLVVWIGEFGHTPKINKNAGRDHWGQAFSIALAGGGIQGGVVHGSTDKHAAHPIEGIVYPRDILATLFHCLGFPPHTEIHDRFGRPVPISRGEVIQSVIA